MKWRVITAVAQKDILDAVKNMYMLFGLLLPIGLWLLFSLAFPDGDDPPVLNVAIYDPGNSRMAANLRELSHVRLLDTESEAQLLNEVKKEAVGGISIPEGFEAAIQAGDQPELAVYLNRRSGGGALAAFQRLVEQQVWALVGQDAPALVRWNDISTAPNAQVQEEYNFNHFLLTMLLVLSITMAGMFMVPTLLVEEKEKHTLDALLVSPAGPFEVTAGKAIAGMMYAIVGALILLTLNKAWSESWPLILVSVILGSLFAVMVGLLMGGVFRNTNQVNTWSGIVLLLMLAPTWVGIIGPATGFDSVARLIPTYSFQKLMILSLAGNASLAQAWGDMAVLAGSAAILLVAVVWLIKREAK